MSEVFHCKKCGSCCRNLFDELDGIRKGLLLTAKEAKLFPSDMVFPSLGIGTEKRKKIITYQLNAEVCPHIGDKNECLIYEKRPLKCKAFPFDLAGFSIKCPIMSYRKVGQFYTDFAPSRLQYTSSEKLDRYMLNRFRKYSSKGVRAWDYDLAKKKWVINSYYDKII